jgi:16S rRNA (uracil1498-N3)-methyltransferase
MPNTRSVHRFFFDDLSQPRAALTGAEAHHAAAVLRLASGSPVELFDGDGRLARGTIESVSTKRLVVALKEVTTTERPRPPVHLGFAVPKGKRLDWLLEKATELGAASLRAVVFTRSVAGRPHATDLACPKATAKHRRWRVHCVAAAKQCGLLHLPDLPPPQTVAEFLDSAPPGLRLVGMADESARPLAEVIDAAETPEEVTVLIGPEGGLTDDELARVRRVGFQSARLGRTTLRVETAAVALLATANALLQRQSPRPGASRRPQGRGY